MTADNCFIVLSSKTFANEKNLRKEKWMQSKYTVEKLSKKNLTQWKSVAINRSFYVPQACQSFKKISKKFLNSSKKIQKIFKQFKKIKKF